MSSVPFEGKGKQFFAWANVWRSLMSPAKDLLNCLSISGLSCTFVFLCGSVAP